MNSEPIVREVEETYHLSIPKQRIDALDNVLSQNPNISENVVRDLILSTAIGVRVPNPKSYEPDEALSQINVQLDEIWYFLKQITAKTINFEPIDIILNQDRGTISLHVRWTYGEKISESTLFINFGNLESFAEFTDELYNKLNRSLHTNIIPYRLVFLDFGKMSRLACVPLSSARQLLEENKLVFQEIYKDVRDSTESPEINDALVPTINELLEGLKFHTTSEDTEFVIAEDKSESAIREINTILGLHPDAPEINVELKAGTYRKRPCDADKAFAGEQKMSCELVLSGKESKTFIVGDASYNNLGIYLNAVLPETETGNKFYAVINGYKSNDKAYVCCTEEEFEAFRKYGFSAETPELWQQNLDALKLPEADIPEVQEAEPETQEEEIQETAALSDSETADMQVQPEPEEEVHEEAPDTAEISLSVSEGLENQPDETDTSEENAPDDILPDDLLAAVINNEPEILTEPSEGKNEEPLIELSSDKPESSATDDGNSVDIEMAEELEKVLTAQLDAELGKVEETLEASGPAVNSDKENTEESKTA